MKDIKTIVWDYNGTLLDDTEIALKSVNTMLSKRGLPLLSCGRYREVFAFPVIEYYKKIGFDFTCEDWNKTAQEFIDLYASFLPESGIFAKARELLKIFRCNGKKQFILSAMEQNMLNQSVCDEAIFNYFDEVSGIDNIFASSKVENGKNLIKNHDLEPKSVCLLGDTIHDFEVSEELGCSCILIAAGHQSYRRLKKTNCFKVVNSLDEILSLNEICK